MKDLPSYLFAKRKPTLVFLFLSIVLAGVWSQTPKKEGCFSSNNAFKACGVSWVDYAGGITYNCYCNCANTSGNDCTPASSGSTGSSTNTAPNANIDPSQVLIDGLLQGKAIYSPHQSREVEDWIEDYWQRMKSMGLPYDINNKLTPDDVPLTGDMKFDNLYSNLMYSYSNTNQGEAVDLTNKKGVVDPNDLKNPTINTTNNQEVVQLPVSGEVWYKPEPMINGGIPPLPQSNGNGRNEGSKDHPAIDLVREASVTAVSWLPGEAGYVGIVAVNIWAEDAKGINDIWNGKTPPSTTTMLVNAFSESAPDLANQAMGDIKEGLISKVFEKASGSKGFAELVVSAYKGNEKLKDLGGEVTGGEGDGIFGKISKAAWILGHPGNNQ